MDIRQHSEIIIRDAISAVMPGEAVRKALKGIEMGSGRVILLSIGKAGWSMAQAACEVLSGKADRGMVITKYGHSRGELPGLSIMEAGHPVPDENTYAATEAALSLTAGLTAEDTVIFLVSGGGSALFEAPIISPEEIADVNRQLLYSGASIAEINTLRKRLSRVKGGRFARHCSPARVISVLLSDVLGNRPDLIASGPACEDITSDEEALRIVERYALRLSSGAMEAIRQPLPRGLDNVETYITGSVTELCRAAENAASKLGYETVLLTDCLNGEARQAGAFLGSIAQTHQHSDRSLAFICGGETVVHVTGDGLGGRNQELALAAAEYLNGCRDTLLFSVGSDGTDGPTDAAGGWVDEHTAGRLAQKGLSIPDVLSHNDAYHALEAVDGLVITGATGTNVNDLTVLLIGR